MNTRWDKFEIPAHWSKPEAVAMQRFRVFCEEQSNLPGGLKAFSEKIGYPKADSTRQILKALQKVGTQMLRRMHEAGYSAEASAIFPEHEFVRNLARKTSEVYLPEVQMGVAASGANESPSPYAVSKGVQVFARPEDIPADAFFVRATDDPKGRVVWVCDPHFEGDTGTRPLVIQSDAGLEVVLGENRSSKQNVIAVVVLETMEVHCKD